MLPFFSPHSAALTPQVYIFVYPSFFSEISLKHLSMMLKPINTLPLNNIFLWFPPVQGGQTYSQEVVECILVVT